MCQNVNLKENLDQGGQFPHFWNLLLAFIGFSRKGAHMCVHFHGKLAQAEVHELADICYVTVLVDQVSTWA